MIARTGRRTDPCHVATMPADRDGFRAMAARAQDADSSGPAAAMRLRPMRSAPAARNRQPDRFVDGGIALIEPSPN
jgi:hypothetical protein